ncbi:MAG: DNA repair protein RadA [candidate division NC10 bacterium]|nr:DNA repair protein RadA [candidate division NC10 bacterium]
MPKPRVVFVCGECGYQTPRWLGRCPDCQGWDTLEEKRWVEEKGGQGGGGVAEGEISKPVAITEMEGGSQTRMPTGIREFDRTLGGGILPGSLILVGGDPGIGKSTLLMQACANLSRNGESVLYVSGEESVEQVRHRALRLEAVSDRFFLATETHLEHILAQVEWVNPALLVVDSIQTTFSEALPSPPGSIGQVREVAHRLLRLAKGRKLSVFIVGHVTKDGSVAGPRALEHIVDTVIYFEGEKQNLYRILRATKNRFGSTQEIGIFEMTESGLKEVENPSQSFLSERSVGASGSVIVPIVEGTRPLLIEVQALVSSTNAAIPRKMATGVDSNRTQLLMAVLEKRMGIPLQAADVYVNVPGGIRVEETAADLGIAAALLSSCRNRPIAKGVVVLGEVGLVGEVRGVGQVERRLSEAAHHGFSRCLLPRSNLSRLSSHWEMELVGLEKIERLSDQLFAEK